ncbi:MAG: hypothetical protein ACD_37C00116G0001, partial [uncultured bacterium]
MPRCDAASISIRSRFDPSVIDKQLLHLLQGALL